MIQVNKIDLSKYLHVSFYTAETPKTSMDQVVKEIWGFLKSEFL